VQEQGTADGSTGGNGKRRNRAQQKAAQGGTAKGSIGHSRRQHRGHSIGSIGHSRRQHSGHSKRQHRAQQTAA